MRNESTSKAKINSTSRDAISPDVESGTAKTKDKAKDTTMAKALATMISHAKAPPRVLTEVHLIPMERITVKVQVRTIFNEESIQELASDIAARGLRSPIETRHHANQNSAPRKNWMKSRHRTE